MLQKEQNIGLQLIKRIMRGRVLFIMNRFWCLEKLVSIVLLKKYTFFD
jgi:hypothetical protein